MDIRNFKPQPHPTKIVFRENNISYTAIAAAVSRSYGYVIDILNGVRSAIPAIDSKLNELASSLNESEPGVKDSSPLLVVRIGVKGIVETGGPLGTSINRPLGTSINI